MDIKTVIVDLDRTLLRTDKTISPYTAAVLGECRRRGIWLVAATARPLRAVTEYCGAIKFDALVVSNGARLLWGNRQEEHGISARNAERVLRSLQAHPDLRITLETGDRAYSNRPIPDFESTICDDLTGPAVREGALKILVGLDREEVLTIVEDALTEDLYYTVANGHLIQIMSRDATKWKGVKAALEAGGRSPDEVAYFGDDQDDIEPIQMCGMGIAVANAIEAVKSAADHVAESNDADGVAKFIERTFLVWRAAHRAVPLLTRADGLTIIK